MKKEITLVLTILILWVGFSNAQQGQWTWMKGDSTFWSNGHFVQQLDSFNVTNYPTSLYDAYGWKDLNGNFWLFGGNEDGSHFFNNLYEFKPSINQWASIKPGSSNSEKGKYGIQNIGAPSNIPGARVNGITWVDTSGNLWLFGGNGFDKDSVRGCLNDLWKYSIATNEWTWIAGSDTINDAGNYGTIMVSSSTNNPPARENTNASWLDNNNCLWLFGGFELYGNQGHLSDLWKFDVATSQWTWMKGPNTLDQPSVYGTIGVSNNANVPSGRMVSAHWKDSHGNFWLFGGSSAGTTVNTLNDMWRYNPSTNEWTWMNGTDNINNTGNGSTLCSASTNNLPGSRYENSACWTLNCDNFVFFGGSIDSSTSNNGGDLWSYSVNTNKWTLMNGTITPDDSGNYGAKLVSSPTNLPESRQGAVGWIDNSGNLWLFGGQSIHNSRRFSDLWRYVPDTSCPALCVGAGINEIIKNRPSSSIYPNPSNGNFVINIGTKNGEMVNIEIYNSMGQKVYNSTDIAPTEQFTKEVDLKNNDDGIYYVRETGTLTNNSWKVVLVK